MLVFYIAGMDFMHKTTRWFHPGLHLLVATGVSMLSALMAFWSMEIQRQTWLTFIAFYVILGAMTVMFIYRGKLTNPKTKQLLHLSFFLMGFVLMVTGVLGMINSSSAMAAVFLLMLFLPGLATLRAGIHFNKTGD